MALPVLVIRSLSGQTPGVLHDTTRIGSGLPLRPTRHIQFATHEGTWQSVDVSPDGRTLVFDLLGDLYTLPIEGGHATRITSGMAIDVQPRFSPDGRRILFLSDRRGSYDIWIANVDGSDAHSITPRDSAPQADPRYLTPVWLDDGAHVLVSQHHPGGYGEDVVVYDTLGHLDSAFHLTAPPLALGGPTEPNAAYTAAPATTRTSGQLAVYATAGTSNRSPTGMPAGLMYQIVRIDPTTGERTVVTHERTGAAQPLVSPDGRFLVYASLYDGADRPQTGLRCRDLTTGETTWLVSQIDPSQQQTFIRWQFGFLPNMAFTPDSRAVVAAFGGKLWRITVPSGQRREIPFTADVDQDLGPLLRVPRRLTDSAFTTRIVRDVRRSPDSRHLAFVALDRVWVLDLRRGFPSRVTRDAPCAEGLACVQPTEHAPAWSPDGRFLAYATWDEPGGGGHVYRVRIEPGRSVVSAPERLTREPDYYDNVVYAPDGQRIVFVRAPWQLAHDLPFLAGRGEVGLTLTLVSMPAAGGVARTLTSLGSHPYEHGWPHFSQRDTTRVFIYASDTLWAVRRDSGGRDAIATVRPDWPPVAVDLLMSPAGDQALFVNASTIALVDLRRRAGVVHVAFDTGNPEYRDTAAVQTQVLTPQGGEFAWWATDGRSFTYSLGHTVFTQPLGAGAIPAPTRRDVRIRATPGRPHGDVILSGARVLTMHNGRVLDTADVLIRDNRIAAVGPHGAIPVPSDATRFDVTGKTVLPGYIATHEHVEAPWDVHTSRVWQYLLFLAYGVTTIHDPQTQASADRFTYIDRLTTGDLIGPRVVSTGTAVMAQRLTTWGETRDVVRRYSRYYDSQMLKERDAGARELRQWVAIAAGEERLTPVGHWEDPWSMVLDGYSGIEHATFTPWYDDIMQLYARSGTVYTPTTMVASIGAEPMGYFAQRTDFALEHKLTRFGSLRGIADMVEPMQGYFPLGLTRDYTFPLEAAQAAKLVAAGGKVGVATDGFAPGLGDHWEMWALAMGGMAPADVLRSATLTGAEALGLDRDLGSIEPGKIADLQVLDRNPLEDIHNTNSVRYVMHNGRLYDAETLDEIWPHHRSLLAPGERPWWWDALPPVPDTATH